MPSRRVFWIVSRNNASSDKYKICPVQDFSIFTGFSCCSLEDDDKDLDDFIQNDAERHRSDLMAVTYGVFFPEEELSTLPLAFFTLQNDALKIKNSSYPYSQSPAVKIGRFGVNRSFQGNGIGTDILTRIKDFMLTDNRTGCRYITLDAYNKPKVIKFYTQRNGFVHLKEPNPDRYQEILYFDLLRHRHP